MKIPFLARLFGKSEKQKAFEPYHFHVANVDNKHAKSAIHKISEQAKPGAIIQLTKEEFDALKTDVIAIDVSGRSIGGS